MEVVSKHRRIARHIPSLLILPALMPLILIILLPALRTIVMSFQRVTFGVPPEWVGVANFAKMFKDAVFHVSFLHTLLFTFSSVAGQILLGIAAAVLMGTRFRLQKFYISLIMVPYAVSEVVAIIIWKYMLTPDVGIINYILEAILGLPQIQWITIPYQTWLVIIAIRIWLSSPFAFLIIYSSLIGVPQELYESAYIDGANNWQGFRYVTVPLITPAIMVATIFGFVFEFRNFPTVWILTGGGPVRRTELLSTLLYKQAFSLFEFGFASAIAIVMTLLTFVIAIFYLRNMYQQMFLKQK
jgi:multiple sugar transport system permease protein